MYLAVAFSHRPRALKIIWITSRAQRHRNAVAVLHVEALGLLAVAGEVELAVGEHAVHVHQQATDARQPRSLTAVALSTASNAAHLHRRQCNISAFTDKRAAAH